METKSNPNNKTSSHPSAVVTPKPLQTLKINPSDPQIQVYAGYLKIAMKKGDIQEIGELIYEIKDQGFDEHLDLTEAENLVFGE